jgi:hypothetical protein
MALTSAYWGASKGPLHVGIYVNGDVVDEASDDSSAAPLSVYYAGNEKLGGHRTGATLGRRMHARGG